ncbi:hypothetical protein [Methylocystis heyeri]|uniref:Uncharacterized protein n=1 Tax=Methylocystis heyeri TaxID=391905 RepID=A0A6B8KFP1_9HYPH|nr:hypothetical protein [Methylocystis heyeri]QGM45250.1 hypothetical protein H2LOC_005825 [Methylocystis heyeri]
MTRLRGSAFLTSLLVIALCACTISGAATLLRFGVEELIVDGENAEARLRPFTGSAWVGYLARRDLLADSVGEDASERLADISGLLSGAPLSSEAWLELARLRRAQGAPLSETIGALAMSHLTGPNEGPLMGRRVGLALPLWSALPPDIRRMLISDLIGGGWGYLDQPGQTALPAVLRLSREESRAELRAALSRAGEPGAAIVRALDLDASGSN